MYSHVEDVNRHIPELPQGNLMQFGVYTGNTLRRIIRGTQEVNYTFDEVWGFDSWQGLPTETEGLWQNPDWPAGAFSVKTDVTLQSDEECIQYVTGRINEFVGPGVPPLNFVSGFFDTSLTAELGKSLRNSVSYLDVDVDIYKSTIECLKWVFTHGVLKQGALVRFDDWLYNGQWAGNNRAFSELTQLYRVSWYQVSDNVYFYNGHKRV